MKELPESDFPGQLHSRIIGKLVVTKFKTFFVATTCFLILNLLVLSWHIWTRVIDGEGYTLFSALLQDFQFSYSYISDLFGMVFDVVPVTLVAAFVLNLVLIAYMIYFRSSINSSLKEKLI